MYLWICLWGLQLLTSKHNMSFVNAGMICCVRALHFIWVSIIPACNVKLNNLAGYPYKIRFFTWLIECHFVPCYKQHLKGSMDELIQISFYLSLWFYKYDVNLYFKQTDIKHKDKDIQIRKSHFWNPK